MYEEYGQVANFDIIDRSQILNQWMNDGHQFCQFNVELSPNQV